MIMDYANIKKLNILQSVYYIANNLIFDCCIN